MKPSNERHRVVAVEDSPTQAEKLRSTLDRGGYDTEICHDGESAIERISSEPPDAVISDVIMPGMDGYQLCRKVRELHTPQRIPVILLTALSDPLDVLRGLEVGADNFIVKPYQEEWLLQGLSRVLRPRDETDRGCAPVLLDFNGERFSISATREQILDFFVTSYEMVLRTRNEIHALNQELEHRVEVRTQELKRRAQELERSYAELEQISYLTSHHLKEALVSVSSYSEMLVRQCRGKVHATADRCLETVRQGVQRLTTIIDDLLLYSLSGEELAVVDSDVSLLAQEARDGIRDALEESGGVIEIGSLPVLPVNPAQIKQVFHNLFDNAIKFHGLKPPHVIISSRKEEDRWIIAVRDTGIGIDPKYFEEIFVISERAHEGFSFMGTGVGLAICRKIIERHGGTIWVESTPGSGSTIFFSLPEIRPASRSSPAPRPMETRHH